MTADTRVLVFAKAPVPGHAKTRLAPALGLRGAAMLQTHLTLRTLRTARQARLGPVELWCAPDCSHRLFRRLRRWIAVDCQGQRGADLGARMSSAVQAALRRSASVLLVGTDAPALTPALLRSAAANLTAWELVFVPAADGGYVLLGARRHVPAIFEGIDWGTERVWAQTRARLTRLGVRWTELPMLWDLDRPEDLERPMGGALTRRIRSLQRNRRRARRPGSLRAD